VGRRLDTLLYGRTATAPPRAPVLEAAAARVALARRPSGVATTPWGFGPPLAGFEPPFPFDTPVWFDRSAAMSVPAVSRCRDLICSAVAALPFTLWTSDWTAIPAIEEQLPPYPWMLRPDPDRTRQWLLAWTTDDLLFHGKAHWEITGRYATTYPSTFRRIEPGDLTETADGWTVSDPVTGVRRPIREADIVEFLSPIEAFLSNGWRTISIALQLDAAADRFAGVEIPAGVLEEQEGSEDLSADDLAEIANTFATARRMNTVAATNKYVKYREIQVNADAMQLVESRQYQALEAARLGNVPPYLVGAPAGTGMTYLNGQQARQDLIDFGASAYIGCLEQTLSGPNVTPRGQAIRLDQNAWLRNPFTTGATGVPSPNDMQIADPTTEAPAP
jgi:Phage portal protein